MFLYPRRIASLAGYLCYLADKKLFDVGQIVRKYEEWVLEHKYMIMAHEREAWTKDAGEFEYVAVKCAKYSHDDKKGKQNLAMCWVFRKKAFYVSGQFRKALSDLIRLSCIS